MVNHKCEHGVAPTANYAVNTREAATVTSPDTNLQAASPVTITVDKAHAVNPVVAPTTTSTVYTQTETPVTTSVDKTHAADPIVAHTAGSAINVHDAATIIKVHEAATIANLHDTTPIAALDVAPDAIPVTAPDATPVVAPNAIPVTAPDATPVVAPNATPVVPAELSTSAAAIVIASDNDDATAPLAKRPRTSSLFRDSVGQEVTPARLNEVIESLLYISLPTAAARYRQIFGHELFAEDSDPHDVLEELGIAEGFRLQSFRLTSVGTSNMASQTFLRHDGPGFARIRSQFKRRLGLTQLLAPPIPAPLLYYHLIMLAGVPVGQLTGADLAFMFETATGQDLTSLRVATGSGILNIPEEDIYVRLRTWMRRLCRFVKRSGSVKKSLGMAETCRKQYTKACLSVGNTDPNLDPRGAVAEGLLTEGLWCSRLFLGIHKPDLLTILKSLPYTMDKDAGEDMKTYIKELSDSLITQPYNI